MGLYKGTLRVTRPVGQAGRGAMVDGRFVEPEDEVTIVYDGPAEVQDIRAREVTRDAPEGRPHSTQEVEVFLPNGTTKIGIEGGIHLEDSCEIRFQPDAIPRQGRIRALRVMDQSAVVRYLD